MAFFAGQGAARDLDVDFSTRVGQVTAALAALGLAAVPSPYNSLFLLERTQTENVSFRSANAGGGGTPFAGSNVYLEGYLAGQDYEPDFNVNGTQAGFNVPVRWRSAAATVGAGYSFDLAPGLKLTPIANFSLGRITSNSEIPDGSDPSGDVDFIAGGGVTAVGYGPALALDYVSDLPEREIALRGRLTKMRLEPIAGNSDVDAQADANTAAFLARVKVPIPNSRAFGGPVRSVYELTYAYYGGDPGELLGLPWLARAGVGFEVETGPERAVKPKRVRVMFRYVFGEGFGGFGAGLGLKF